MQVYFTRLELQGPLFFSSEVKHALTEKTHLVVAPKAIISSIPLTYGINNLPAEAYAWNISKGPTYSMIERLMRKRFSYAAVPTRVRYRKFFFSMKGMSWGEYRGKPKTNAPRMVTLIAMIPPSSFRTVVVSDDILPRTIYFRIGSKRSGILKATFEEVKKMKEVTEEMLSLPVERKMLEIMGCKIKSFVTLLSTFSGGEVGLAEVQGCKVVKACSQRRCETIALP